MLSSQWSLHDVDDVEALIQWAVPADWAGLSRQEREDLVAYLLVIAWQLSERFDPARGRFSTFLRSIVHPPGDRLGSRRARTHHLAVLR